MHTDAGSRRKPPILAIVVPCFNEAVVVAETATRLMAVLGELVRQGVTAAESFLYFVDDGSRDGTWDIIAGIHQGNPRVKGLKLSRNFGHQNALLAGLLSVKDRCECAITIDADLQHDEQAIPQFVEKYLAGADLVFGVRNDRRGDSPLKKGTALFFYNLMKWMGVNIVKNHADYRLVGRKALEALATYGETNLFLRGIFATMGFRIEYVPFDVKERHAGKSKYSFVRMLGLAFSGITSFSIVPLRIVTLIGFLVFLISTAMIMYVLYVAVIEEKAFPGWASTVLPIYFLGGIQLLSIGLLGEYVGRIYSETKARPRYIRDIELF